jgi:hypothetical protein
MSFPPLLFDNCTNHFIGAPLRSRHVPDASAKHILSELVAYKQTRYCEEEGISSNGGGNEKR